MTKKRIYLNAFAMNCVGHQSPGLWKHPEDQSSRYTDIDFWTDLARLLEKGRFDGLFLADVIGIYDVYGGDKTAAIRDAAQSPAGDPALLVSAMAHATEHLGFGITCSTTYEHPYTFARRMSTLDHLTKGRIGWNIVTSYLDSGTKNIGLERPIPHDRRYQMADEYVEVCYKLWEGSWEDGAVVRDAGTGVFTDPDKVHDIGHDGTYYHVPGIHLSEPSPQRTPVLFQAGGSASGKQFAAKHAECTFISAPSKEAIRSYVSDLRKAAADAGRDPESIKIFSLLTPIVGQTEEEAQAKYEELKDYISYEGALALLSGWTGIDFSDYHADDEIRYIETNSVRSRLEMLTKADPDKIWTVRELAQFVGIGGFGPVAVGTPQQIADTLEEWIRDTGVDGFNLAYALVPGTFRDFIELVIPELQARGLVQTDYAEGTYREKLFGKLARLEEPHPGARYRRTAGALS